MNFTEPSTTQTSSSCPTQPRSAPPSSLTALHHLPRAPTIKLVVKVGVEVVVAVVVVVVVVAVAVAVAVV